MQVANIMKMSIAVMIAALLMVSIVAPLVDSASKETTTITNEGAGDLRYTYAAEPVDYSSTIVYNDVSDEITAGFGSADLQTIAAVESIIWASNIGSIIFNGATFYLMIDDGEHVVNADLGDGCDISVAEGVVSIADADDTVYSGAITWSYAPQKNGQFGFFTDSGATVNDFPAATAGTFAGAYAYNSINSLGHSTLAPTYSITDGVFTTGPWTVPDLGAKTVKEIKEIKEIKETEEKEIIEAEKPAIKASTPQYTDGDWGFDLSSSQATIVSYSGSGGNISIPSTVSTGGTSYPVVQVGKNNVYSPIFPTPITTQSTLTIPDSVTTIGQFAFMGFTGLTAVTIPDSVTSLGTNVFSGCSGLTAVTIPDSVTTLGNGVFYNCSGLTAVTISDSITTISKNTFMGCSGLTAVTIPDSVTTIGASAFSGCTGLTAVTIPDSVTTLGNAVFYNCSGLTAVTISDSITTIGGSAFLGCTGLTAVTIPDSVTTINSYAFADCTGVKDLVILGSPTIDATRSLEFANAEEVLNLGNTQITAGSYGIAADAVIDDEIPPLGYLAPVSFSATVAKEGTLYTVMGMLPVLMLAGVLVMTAAAFINNRRA